MAKYERITDGKILEGELTNSGDYVIVEGYPISILALKKLPEEPKQEENPYTQTRKTLSSLTNESLINVLITATQSMQRNAETKPEIYHLSFNYRKLVKEEILKRMGEAE